MQMIPQHYDTKMFMIIDKVTYLAIVVHIVLIGVFFWLDHIVLAFVNVFSTLAWMYGRDLNAKGKQPLAILFLSAEVIVHNIIAVPILGWDSGFQYYLITALMFNIFRGDINMVQMLGTILLFLGTFTGLHVYSSFQVYTLEPLWLIPVMYYANMIVALSVMSLIGFYFQQATTVREKEIHIRANTDLLTGLQTRRSLKNDLISMLNYRESEHKESVVIMADIDHFKSINDTYGHGCGDEVLKEVAKRLKENLRTYDKVYRWGGEEFLIILTNTNMLDATKVAEGLCQKIASVVCTFEGYEVNVSMTFGLAPFNIEHANIDEVIIRADKALYKGKQNGRNCVMVADQDHYETICMQHQTAPLHYAI
ncbi:MAG: diguanylate cyclase [Sulfurimonadaceae bacterium]